MEKDTLITQAIVTEDEKIDATGMPFPSGPTDVAEELETTDATAEEEGDDQGTHDGFVWSTERSVYTTIMGEFKGETIETGGLIEGYHGTRDEIKFVWEVINGHLRPAGYKRPISLAGSRREGWWISRNRFNDFLQENDVDLTQKIHDQWLQWLNSKAISHKLNRNQIPLLVDQLPKNAPEIVQRFLEEGDPGSDFDLLLFGKRPPDVDPIYSSLKTKWQI